MKNKSKVSVSFSVVIGAVITILALVRGTWQFGLLCLVIGLWWLWLLLTVLVPAVVQSNRRKKQAKKLRQYENGSTPLHKNGRPESEFRVPSVDGEEDAVHKEQETATEHLLLYHVNYRISGYLRSVYPDATWEWCTKNPERFASHGGRARIRVYGIKDYDHAEVTLDNRAAIQCQLLHIAPLNTDSAAPGKPTPPNKQPVDPGIWYEAKGRSVLEAVIRDLESRGHNTAVLHEDGSICIRQDSKEVKQEQLMDFPAKVYWPQLIKTLESTGLAAKATPQGVQISW